MDAKNKYDIAVGVVLPDAVQPNQTLIGQIAEGMSGYFGAFQWSLVHAHAGPYPHDFADLPGLERQCGLAVPWGGIQYVTYPWHGLPGKTAAYRAIFARADADGATVCLMVDPRCGSLEPASIDALIRPGLHSRHDLVTPVSGSDRARYLLSSQLISPVLKGLFGAGPARPLSSTFAVSQTLMRRLLARRDWDSAAARFVPELWINFIAAAEGYRRAEAFASQSESLPRSSPLSPQAAIHQIIESLFTLMEQYEGCWVRGAKLDPIEEFGRSTVERAEGARIDGLDYLVRFMESHRALGAQWRALLDPHTWHQVDTFAAALQRGETESFLADQAWVRVLHELASHWKRRSRPRKQIIGLLIPLYWARVGSFLMKTQWSEQSEVRQQLARLGEYFESLRPALSDWWTGRRVHPAKAA